MDRHYTETELLDRMEEYLAALCKGGVGYRFDEHGLVTIMSATPKTLEVVRHPAFLLQVYVEASHKDPDAWQFLLDAVREYRRRDLMPPAVLTRWALDALAGIFTKPERPRGRPSQADRDAVIIWTVRDLRDETALPYESRDRRSACRAVADRLHLSYEAVATIWRRRAP